MIPRDPLNGAFFSGSAAAHYIAGRYSDAVNCARQAVQLRYGLPAAHRILCASLAQAGQVEEARSALSTLQRLQPDLSVAWIRESVPFTPSPMAHFLDGMRKAGLTE